MLTTPKGRLRVSILADGAGADGARKALAFRTSMTTNMVAEQAFVATDTLGLGDCALVWRQGFGAKKALDEVFFARGNVAVHVDGRIDRISVAALAKEIDRKLKAVAIVKDLGPYRPRGLVLSVAPAAPRVGDKVQVRAKADEGATGPLTIEVLAGSPAVPNSVGWTGGVKVLSHPEGDHWLAEHAGTARLWMNAWTKSGLFSTESRVVVVGEK